MTRPLYYAETPDGGVRPCTPLEVEALYASVEARVVAHDTDGRHEVSTVFLGIDHSHRLEGEPVLYETMVFVSGRACGGIASARYHTRAQAIAGHAAHVAEWLRREDAP